MIFVTGFHHSGTSLLARLVDKLGVKFDGPLDRHHENEDLKKIDDLLIGDWLNPVEKVNDDFLIKGVDPSKIEAYKNPRLMVTAPVWQKNFPGSRWIWIERDAIDVIHSMTDEKTRSQDPLFWMELIAKYSDSFLNFIVKNKYVFVQNFLKIRYDRLCAWPEMHVRMLASFLGVEPKEEVIKWAKENIKLKTYRQ